MQVNGIHLHLPGFDNSGPTLEIFQYSKASKKTASKINQPGFAHIAFAVRNVKEMLGKVKRNGGSSVGDLVSTTIEGIGRINVVYARVSRRKHHRIAEVGVTVCNKKEKDYWVKEIVRRGANR